MSFVNEQPLHAMNTTSLFTPLTYSLHRFANETTDLQKKKCALSAIYVARPIDRLIQIVACLIFSIGEHFHDIHLLRKKKDYSYFFKKVVATPLWLPLKVSIKVFLFALCSFRDLFIEDIINLSAVVDRLRRPDQYHQDWCLLRDFEKREATMKGERVWCMTLFEPKALQGLSLEQRAILISDMKKSRARQEIAKVYGL